MLLCNGVYDDNLSFTIDTYVFFYTKVLFFIFSLIKSPFDSACNVTSDAILAW